MATNNKKAGGSHGTRPLLVLSSGIFALVLTMGVARFAYTPMLAHMQAQTGLSDALAGWLAGWNYLGYLSGLLLVTALKDLMLKDRLYRIALVLAVLTTAMMALDDAPLLWGVSRYLAGISTAGGLMLGSGLILNWLIRHGHRGELGLHFSGIGLGILVGALVVELAALATDWRGQWWLLTALGALLLVPAWGWLPRPNQGTPLAHHHSAGTQEPGPLWLWLLQGAYLCAGFGYVVNATFTVLITEQQPALAGQGGLMWMLVGLAATPAPLLWDRLARRLGYLHALQWGYGLQILGILLPVFSPTLVAAVISALLFGWTFIGIVSLVLTMVGVRYPAHPAAIMARLTLGYGVAQIIAPVVAGELAENTGRFDLSLLMVAAIMLLGLCCLAAMRWLREQA
ncbi:MFS transporter, aromatic acid:H+ symporter (AAHS) family [Thiorhodovibrio winogradskyi]|uniref:MFS transporter, aromatic acid:H+ symporter (AAHS) family n=1 Tax=Thiorhodovibrio winogradskyi TaxID=77007 RepID=A0ABZ0SEJ9_9GAMM|nr:YbfB/YjiJ family MFS transporter [Thiorhodovibrio winogradskyi]